MGLGLGLVAAELASLVEVEREAVEARGGLLLRRRRRRRVARESVHAVDEGVVGARRRGSG